MRSTPFIQARAAQSVELSHVFMYRGVARKTRRYAHFLLRIFPATSCANVCSCIRPRKSRLGRNDERES